MEDNQTEDELNRLAFEEQKQKLESQLFKPDIIEKKKLILAKDVEYCGNCGSSLLMGNNQAFRCLECQRIIPIQNREVEKLDFLKVAFAICLGVFIGYSFYVYSPVDALIYYDFNPQMDVVPSILSNYSYKIYVLNDTRKINGTYLYGEYNSMRDTIYLYNNRDTNTLLHEIGHRYYYKSLSSQQKREWINISQTYGEHISDYAMTEETEDFAESFSCYYANQTKPMVRTIHETRVYSKGCKYLLEKNRLKFLENTENAEVNND